MTLRGSGLSPAAVAKLPAMLATVLPGDQILVSQVMSILTAPVSAQRPDLKHFRLLAVTAGSGAPPGAGPRGAAHGSGGLIPALVISSGLLLLVALAGLLALQWTGRLGRVRRLARVAIQAAAMLPPAALAALIIVNVGAGGAVTVESASRLAASGVAHGALLSALRSHAVTVPVGVASRTWSELVGIEAAIGTQHDHLVADEQQISVLSVELAGAAPAPPVETRRPPLPVVLRTALQAAVTDHQDTMTSYTASLADEYDFFLAAARLPQTAVELQSVAAHTPPEVQQAVDTNIGLVTTQLLQEQQIAEAEQLQAASGGTVATVGGSAPSFEAPVSGVVTQPFGPTQFALELPLTYNRVFYPHFHTGVDIAAALDTPVHAAAAGKVVLAASSVDPQGNLTGYGNYVVIAHADGFMTLYGHLDKITVKAGQTLAQGQVIGLLGSTGSSTGPHVHFEIRVHGVYVDPAPYLATALRH